MHARIPGRVVGQINTQIDNLNLRRPLKCYTREIEVDQELMSLEDLSPGVLAARLGGDEGRALHAETLVAAIRACVRSGCERPAGRILTGLCDRIVGRTQHHLTVWGIHGRDDREDLAREIVATVVDCVLRLDDAQEFWECRFWTCFDRRVRTIMRDKVDRLRAHSLDHGPEDSPREVAAAGAVSVQEWSLASAALQSLPEPLRTAFLLKHYGAYKEESRDPGEQTIATILAVTGRSVRNYLRRADEMLSEWRDQHAQ